jgi:hypothetical protein
MGIKTGLYRFKRLMMGNNLASSECQKHVKEVIQGSNKRGYVCAWD